MFGEIKWYKKALHVTVKRKPETDNEFNDFLVEWENMFAKINYEFVMALNLRSMERITMTQSLAFIKLFIRMLPVIRTYLSCTVVCLNDGLKEPSDMFLKLYNPSKPYYVCFSDDDFQATVKTHRRKLKAM
jgi:hypothetical protein